jgi:hypothetical protein
MSGIYQKQTNSGSVASPSAGRTLISVNESGELFTKDSSGAVSITQPKFTAVPSFHLLDVGSLLDAITADPFAVADWKATFTGVTATPGVIINGVFDTNGDFSTEVSNWKAVGIADEGDGAALTSILASANFRPTDGTILGGIEISNSFIQYNFDNFQWTYKYEEDPTATGANPKYLHDFRITVDSTQILGYVLINADDSISANTFITDSAGG